jgi:tetratricopeptide (TPR) repeat protein
MGRNLLRCLGLLLVLAMASRQDVIQEASADNAGNNKTNRSIPFSTKSAEAREALEHGLMEWEKHRAPQAKEEFRKATQADPNFAAPHLFLSILTASPDEQSSELKEALALRDSQNQDEQALIDWLANTSQSHILPAITAMNELLQRYPEDTHLLYRAAIWLRDQRQSDRAVKLYERLLKLDPQFAEALNQLGYTYAYDGNFDKAIATMKRYVDLLPNEPNPEDSYAEILRMAGRFQEAIAHYHRALQIDPSLPTSQEGIAATYSLMGDQAQARLDYAKAIAHAPSPATAMPCTIFSAVTWLREKKYAEATGILRQAAQRAHESGLAESESVAYRVMSLYEKDPMKRQQLLDQAEAALRDGHILAELVRQRQMALILRTRIYADLDAGDMAAANSYLDQLSAAWEKTQDGYVKTVWHGAAGAVLLSRGKYEEAIDELLEDDLNPYSLNFLAQAYQANSNAARAARWATRVSQVRNPKGALDPYVLEAALLKEGIPKRKI